MREEIFKNDVVINVIEGHIEGSVECTGDVGIGYLYDGISFTPPEPEPLTINEQALELNAACKAAIEGGFESSALGAVYTYESKLEDQLNLIGAASAGVELPYQCTDAAGVKAEVVHTAAQVQRVFADGVAFKSTKLSECRAAVAAL